VAACTQTYTATWNQPIDPETKTLNGSAVVNTFKPVEPSR
jgi:hypothetical protein